MTSSVPSKQLGRGRRVAFAALAILFAAASLGGLFGIGLVIGWFDNDDGKIHRVHDIAFGVLFGIIVTVAFLAQLRRPESKVSPRYQILAAAAASLIAGLMATDGAGVFFFLVLVLALAILVAVHPVGLSLLRGTASVSRPLAAMAAVGAIPLLWFALTTARLQRTGPPTDLHVKGSHWTVMTAMLLGILLVALLASLRLGGWRTSAWCAGLGAFTYGLASAVFAKFPNTQLPYPGSKGVGWGLVAMAGGAVFVAVAEWEARRRPVAESV
jgi:hypothetical protein